MPKFNTNFHLSPHIGIGFPLLNLEDGMPGTPLKLLGGVIAMLGVAAGGLTAIFLTSNPLLGAVIAIASLVVGMIIAGIGMYQNFQKNKEWRLKQEEYMDNINKQQEQNLKKENSIDNNKTQEKKQNDKKDQNNTEVKTEEENQVKKENNGKIPLIQRKNIKQEVSLSKDNINNEYQQDIT